MIKKTVSKTEFVRDFQNIRPNHFTRAGLECLFELLNDLSAEMWQDIEFNIISMCGQFTEYTNLKQAAQDLGVEVKEIKDCWYCRQFEGGLILDIYSI